MWRRKSRCAPLIHPGVFDATVGRCIFTQLLLSVTAGARAHTVALHCVWTNTEVTWARRQRRARWHRSGYTGSSAPVHHYNRRSERSRAKPKNRKMRPVDDGSPVTRLLAVHPRSHSCGLFLYREIHVWHRVCSGDTERHRGSDVLESQWQTVIRYRCRWRCARGSRSSSWSCRRVSNCPFPRLEREKVNDRRRDERVSALDTCIRFKWARVYVCRTGQSGSGDLGWGQIVCILRHYNT